MDDLTPLTPRRLSLLADLSGGMVGDIEDDRRGVLPRTVRAVAYATGCAEEWIEANEGEPPTREAVRAAIAAAEVRLAEREGRKTQKAGAA